MRAHLRANAWALLVSSCIQRRADRMRLAMRLLRVLMLSSHALVGLNFHRLRTKITRLVSPVSGTGYLALYLLGL